MEYIFTILNIIWIYGGAYAAALATASSFYAVYFFFWTRTGDRKGKIDLPTKKIYLHSIYNVLRFSLYTLIVIKLIEIGLMYSLGVANSIDVGIGTILLSFNGFFIYVLLLVALINSLLMQKQKINFSIGLPVAITTYFFLFLYTTSRALIFDPRNFFVTAFEFGGTRGMFISFAVFIVSVLVVGVVFNYFSRKVRGVSRKS